MYLRKLEKDGHDKVLRFMERRKNEINTPKELPGINCFLKPSPINSASTVETLLRSNQIKVIS